mmetsp:Transcript_20930/g.53201  ORF Transcript_20930/g.53201 Transcript_20930/m.53201 type:complete len:341 (+) Transcript_20930:18-1040(+)
MGKHGAGATVEGEYASRKRKLAKQRNKRDKEAAKAKKALLMNKPEMDNWVKCCECAKWRRLPPGHFIDDDKDAYCWLCYMHPDLTWSSCSVPEQPWVDETGTQNDEELVTYLMTEDGAQAERRRQERIATREHREAGWRAQGAPHDPKLICLHCGLFWHHPDGPDEGEWVCKVSGTRERWKRLRKNVGPTTAMSYKPISQALGCPALFIMLPKEGRARTPRDCSRAAVLALGYDSDSGSDNGQEYLYDDSLRDDQGAFIGTDKDVPPLCYLTAAHATKCTNVSVAEGGTCGCRPGCTCIACRYVQGTWHACRSTLKRERTHDMPDMEAEWAQQQRQRFWD